MSIVNKSAGFLNNVFCIPYMDFKSMYGSISLQSYHNTPESSPARRAFNRSIVLTFALRLRDALCIPAYDSSHCLPLMWSMVSAIRSVPRRLFLISASMYSLSSVNL